MPTRTYNIKIKIDFVTLNAIIGGNIMISEYSRVYYILKISLFFDRKTTCNFVVRLY